MPFHVHIYKVVGKAEINLDEKDDVAAREKALSFAKAGKLDFGESDCAYIALSFEGDY